VALLRPLQARHHFWCSALAVVVVVVVHQCPALTRAPAAAAAAAAQQCVCTQVPKWAAPQQLPWERRGLREAAPQGTVVQVARQHLTLMDLGQPLQALVAVVASQVMTLSATEAQVADLQTRNLQPTGKEAEKAMKEL
jgi:hypothetical protein